MSRFLKTAIVLLAIAAMAAPAFAADNLTLGGQMRVRGWYIDNDSADGTNTFADQRLRIGGKFTIADGVSITFRTDVTESVWGTGNTFGSGRIGVQQWDRAHIDLDFGSTSLRAGQQFVWFLESGAFNTQSNGLVVKTKGPVAVTAFAFLQDNNNVAAADATTTCTVVDGYCTPTTTAAVDASNNADGFNYGVNVGFGADAFKGNVLFAAQNKIANSDEDVYLLGANAVFNLDMVKITAELDYFTGDAAAATDAFGTQLYVDAAFSLSESLTLGGEVFYALGDKEDTQYSYIGNDFGGWDPINEHGTGLNNEQITPGSTGITGGSTRPFEAFGNNAGVMALRVYADSKLSDSFKLGGSITYLEPEEDAQTTVDSALNYTIGCKYVVMSNTSIGAQVEYIDADQTDSTKADSVLAAGLGLFVNF